MSRPTLFLFAVVLGSIGPEAAARDLFDQQRTSLSLQDQHAIAAALALEREPDSRRPPRYSGTPIRVSEIFLSREGSPEVLVQRERPDGSEYLLFAKVNGRYEGVFAAIGRSVEYLPTRSEGYRDLLVRGEEECLVFRWRSPRDLPWGMSERYFCSEPIERYAARRDACSIEGGRWIADGLGRFGGCVKTMADAGKPCQGQEDCQFRCFAPAGTKLGEKVVGTCARTDSPFGCRTEVHEGVARRARCTD